MLGEYAGKAVWLTSSVSDSNLCVCVSLLRVPSQGLVKKAATGSQKNATLSAGGESPYFDTYPDPTTVR